MAFIPTEAPLLGERLGQKRHATLDRGDRQVPGSKLSHDSGVPEAHLRALSRWRESEHFDAVDHLVLEYAEAMTRTPVEVTDALFERLRERFDERQLVELTMSIGLENLYSRTNWAFGIEGEGFSDGIYCVTPDRAAAETLVSGSAAR